MAILQCRYFSGYKPCGFSNSCDESCSAKEIIKNRILIIHLGALGAVVRSTALLAGIRRKFPSSHITWVTQKPADQILRSNPLIDRVIAADSLEIESLRALEFDAAFVIDKSVVASGILKRTKADLTFGFTVDSKTASILPSTPAAQELWELGLSNHKKFFENKKSEIQLVFEALELGSWQYDEYFLPLTEQEKNLKKNRRMEWSQRGKKILGLNTGCSAVMPAKKWTIQTYRRLIARVTSELDVSIVLLGGPEDALRNLQIAKDLPVIQSPTDQGLRDGLVSVASCDLIVTGDSLGMHFAISQRVPVIAWFGPTCDHEIELYGRGIKIKSEMPCSPCWKRSCSNQIMCYDGVDLKQVTDEIRKELRLCPRQEKSIY